MAIKAATIYVAGNLVQVSMDDAGFAFDDNGDYYQRQRKGHWVKVPCPHQIENLRSRGTKPSQGWKHSVQIQGT